MMTEIVRLNVRGTHFEIDRKCLNRHPNTKLGRLNIDSVEYICEKNEYFLNANPVFMNDVLDFYETGELHISSGICSSRILAELRRWEIDIVFLKKCCWAKVFENSDIETTYSELSRAVSHEVNPIHKVTEGRKDTRKITMYSKAQKSMQQIFNQPFSSKIGMVYFCILFLAVLSSVFAYGMIPIMMGKGSSSAKRFPANYTQAQPKTLALTLEHVIVKRIDVISNSILFVDFFLRSLFAMSKKRFLLNPINIIDFVVILTVYIMSFRPESWNDNEHMRNFRVAVRYLFATRAFWILRIAVCFTETKVLLLSVKSSLKELIFLLVTMMSFVLVFGSLIYAVSDDNFPNYFICAWYTVVTMTTVGYGDYYPVTIAGYLVGVLITVCGILLMAMPIAILSSNFHEYYQCMKIQRKVLYAYSRSTNKCSVEDNLDKMDKSDVKMKPSSNLNTYSSTVGK